MKKVLVSFWEVVDIQTFVVSALALYMTYLCRTYGYQADLPTGLISLAIVFPIVFSINAAYKRREEALKFFASIKGHAASIYLGHRDWAGRDSEGAARAKELITSLLERIREYLTCEELKKDQEKLASVYVTIDGISESHEILRKGGDGVSSTEISRLNQYLRAIVIDFERMRNIHLYQTPKSLRAYSQVFLNLFPILYSPYFAFICIDSGVDAAGYAVALIYSLVLVTLDNIQEDLEDPYDGIGEDDVNLDIAEDYSQLLTP